MVDAALKHLKGKWRKKNNLFTIALITKPLKSVIIYDENHVDSFLNNSIFVECCPKGHKIRPHRV